MLSLARDLLSRLLIATESSKLINFWLYLHVASSSTRLSYIAPMTSFLFESWETPQNAPLCSDIAFTCTPYLVKLDFKSVKVCNEASLLCYEVHQFKADDLDCCYTRTYLIVRIETASLTSKLTCLVAPLTESFYRLKSGHNNLICWRHWHGVTRLASDVGAARVFSQSHDVATDSFKMAGRCFVGDELNWFTRSSLVVRFH